MKFEFKDRVCCICGKEFIGAGNNPYGAAWLDKDDQVVEFNFEESNYDCCDDCNDRYVITGRLYRMCGNKELLNTKTDEDVK